jgi:hypothetical protein
MMMRSGRSILLLLFMTGFMHAASTLEWPMAIVTISGEFGTSNMGFPLPGIVLAGTKEDVRSASGGEVVFTRAVHDANTRLPSGLGATVVCELPDGLAAIYANLADQSYPNYSPRIEAGAPVGKGGQSGFAAGAGFYFGLFDRKTDRWVNPRLLLPPQPDKRPPIIKRLILEGGEKAYVLGEQRSIPQGSYSLLVDVNEPVASDWNPGPSPIYYFRIIANGEKLAEVKLDVAATRSGHLDFFPDSKPGAISLQGDGRIRIASRLFARGRSSFEIVVRDFVGNERSAVWTVLVE